MALINQVAPSINMQSHSMALQPDVEISNHKRSHSKSFLERSSDNFDNTIDTMLNLRNRQNTAMPAKQSIATDAGIQIIVPAQEPQIPSIQGSYHSSGLPVTSAGGMGMAGEYSPERTPATIFPSNSVRRKTALGSDLNRKYMLSMAQKAGSLRVVPTQPKVSTLRQARTASLTRTDSLDFKIAKQNSWKLAQDRGYHWAVGDGNQTVKRVKSTFLSETEFIKLMDERMEAAKLERARQIAEYEEERRVAMEILGEPFPERPHVCAKKVEATLKEDDADMETEEESDVDNADYDDENDDRSDDYNLELQCSASESSGTDINEQMDEDGNMLDSDDMETDTDTDTETENEDNSGLAVAAGDSRGGVQENNADNLAGASKAYDAGINAAIEELSLVDLDDLDARTFDRTAFSDANDTWLKEMVPYYKKTCAGRLVWNTIREQFFLQFFHEMSVECLQARYLLIQQGLEDFAIPKN